LRSLAFTKLILPNFGNFLKISSGVKSLHKIIKAGKGGPAGLGKEKVVYFGKVR